MANYVFPANDYDRSQTLLALLGSYWSGTYQGNSLVEDMVFATAQEEAQNFLNLLESINTASRFEVPIFHTENWHLLAMLQSQTNGAETSLPRYGDPGLAYGGAARYGLPFPGPGFAFPIEADLVDVNLIFNRITSPSLTLVKNIDFVIDDVRNAIIFRADPFQNLLVPSRSVFKGSEIVDTEATLWLFKGQFDFDYVHDHWGYTLGLQLKSSEGYRDLINAIYDGIIGGCGIREVQLAYAAMTDIPLVREPQETVEVVTLDATSRLIVTDQHVYKYHPDATPIVAVGDQLLAGQPMVDSLLVSEFGQGVVPADLANLAIGRGILAEGYVGDLVFRNESTPLIVEENVDGKTKISFALGGFPLDVDQFWDDVHREGVQSGTTFANLLDVRTNPDTEPTAASLPATINPLQFLVENFLRNNAFLVRIKLAQVGPRAAGTHSSWLLRKIVPAHTTLIILVELEATDDPVIMDGTTDFLVSELATTFSALEPLTDSLTPAALITEKAATLKTIGGDCV